MRVFEPLTLRPTKPPGGRVCTNLSLVDDHMVESNENLLAVLNTTDGAVILYPAQAIITITDGDGEKEQGEEGVAMDASLFFYI